MSDAIEAGQDAPVYDEATQTAATPDNVATPAQGTETAPDVETQAVEKTFTQKELDEIVQKRTAKAEAIAERRAIKAYAQKLEQMVPQQQQPQAEAENGRPTQAQFANVDDYVEAMADWKLGQRDQAQRQQQQQEQSRSLNSRTESIYAEAAKVPGFDREAFDELPLTQHIAAALIESDAPAKLMAHLAANPDEVERIAGLSPARQAAEIGKLEVKIASAPKVSKAPPPIDPIGGSKGNLSIKPSDEMSDAAYAKWRKTAKN
jgi:hypothetical protein